MKILQNISLKPYNTFGIEVNAKRFVKIESTNQLNGILQNNNLPLLILGGGSNILLTKDFEGLVIKNNIKGIEIVKETENEVILKVGAGEVWHKFVLYCINNGYAGIENLSLIPGCVGASPMQNIGAYGVEVKDVILEVEASHVKNQNITIFKNKDCEFGYRSSIFKTTEKGNYIITSVTFKLNKKAIINTFYGAINNELKRLNIEKPTIKEVSNAVIKIRTEKLPNPAEIGNSGSFFKNPVVNVTVKNKIQKEYPNLPNYPQKNETFKLAAGWLIEQCGWKGKTINNYGVYKNQALVLVNYGGATGKEILELSEDIIQSVKLKFDIELEREVNIL